MNEIAEPRFKSEAEEWTYRQAVWLLQTSTDIDTQTIPLTKKMAAKFNIAAKNHTSLPDVVPPRDRGDLDIDAMCKQVVKMLRDGIKESGK